MKVESGKLTIWREISWRLAIESSACWFAQDAAGRTSKLADYTLEVYAFVPEQALDDFLVELCKRAVLGLANPDPLVIESGDAYFAEKTSGRKKKENSKWPRYTGRRSFLIERGERTGNISLSSLWSLIRERNSFSKLILHRLREQREEEVWRASRLFLGTLKFLWNFFFK